MNKTFEVWDVAPASTNPRGGNDLVCSAVEADTAQEAIEKYLGKSVTATGGKHPQKGYGPARIEYTADRRFFIANQLSKERIAALEDQFKWQLLMKELSI